MAALQGAVESTAPVSRLHEHQSFSLDDFPVPTGREEEWRFTPLRRLRGDTVLRECKVTVVAASVPNGGIASSAAPTCPPTGSVPVVTRPSRRRQ
jgi:Fe-S cluster assembly protein SufD